jgi:predicted glycoside hydrolase/deacetylase ChbG (UPF0249 family)
VRTYAVVDDDDPSEVAQECTRQLELFRSLLGRDPSHLDSHQHAHRNEPLRTALVNLAAELRIPLRHFAPGIQYHGDYYGQTATGEPLPTALTVDALAAVLRSLPPGTSELGCHPASELDFESTYGSERLVECEVLCSAAIRDALEAEDIGLVSFDELRRSSGGDWTSSEGDGVRE